MIFGVEITGGLGNMLFGQAFGEWMEHKHSIKVVYPNAPQWLDALPTHCEWTSHGAEYKTIYKNFDWFKNQDRKDNITKTVVTPFRFREIKPEHGVLYKGYFQSYLYFDRDFARERFAPSDSVSARVDAYGDILDIKNCFIHVRRGNYVVMPQCHPVLTMDYYNKGIAFMKERGVKRFIVFSNDMRWCKENFIGEDFVFIQDTDYIEMFLMSRCDNGIVANSSFSVWGALLGQPEFVIAPHHIGWFGTKHPQDHAKDICPPEWIRF